MTITIIWFIGFLITFRPIFRWWVGLVSYDKVDWADVCLSLILTSVGVFFWPIFVVGTILKNTVGNGDPDVFARRLGGESRTDKTKRLEKEKKERELYIDSLERKLEIGEYVHD
jgi:hypothetical protein